MDADAVVTFLQKVAELQVLQVCLKADVVVSGVGHFIAAHALAQHVTLVAGGAARAVLIRAGGAGGALAHSAGDHTLAGGVLIGAGAAPSLLQVGTNVVVLTAVHDREDVVEPVAERPATETQQYVRFTVDINTFM